MIWFWLRSVNTMRIAVRKTTRIYHLILRTVMIEPSAIVAQCDPICSQADCKTVETVSKSFNMCKCSDHDHSQN